MYIILTRCAQSRTRCELGHINDFDGKLLIGLPVYASPYDGERSSVRNNPGWGGGGGIK